MPVVLLATCADLPHGDEDAAVLLAALARAGVRGRWCAWTDRTVDWTSALVVLRSTWDYTLDRDAFLAWVRGVPRLANPAPIVEWNSDKTYLRDLVRAGVPIVPTVWAAPGHRVVLPDSGEFVVKPSVGAGSRGAGRFSADAVVDAQRHAAALHAAGRTVLVQPYLDGVEATGETALIYLDGEFSHAVGKGAMLAPGVANPVHGWDLFVEERITAREPSAAESALGAKTLAVLRERFGPDPLYARVDLLPGPDGPVVIEVELTEPSLFLGHAHHAPDRFADKIAARA